MLKQQFPLWGQEYAAGAPGKQADLQAVLKFADGLANSRLADR